MSEKKKTQMSAQELMEHERLPKLLARFCIPALASSLVTAVYNIVDQLFIGNDLGTVGNAAVNVVFPAVTLITALSLMCGVGTSAIMNISLGKGDRQTARTAVGSGFSLMVIIGLVCMLAVLLFTRPVLFLFGCTDEIYVYAAPYARIVAAGFAFSILGAAGPFVIRADGSSGFALFSIAFGAVLNIALDALFIVGFGWSIVGAAWATFIAQGASAGIVIWYQIRRFGALDMAPRDYLPNAGMCGRIAKLGAGPACNFATQALVMIFLNNALVTYGAASIYGSEAALAAAGVANKVNTLFAAVFTGLANGMQPIVSYNYGRGNYARVADIGLRVVGAMVAIGFVVLACYQLAPRQITALFGEGTTLYFDFAERYFRIYLMLVPFSGLITAVGGFFSAQGKPLPSIALSLGKQLVLCPLLIAVLPLFFGLDGVLAAGPIGDAVLAVAAFWLFFREIGRLRKRVKSKEKPE